MFLFQREEERERGRKREKEGENEREFTCVKNMIPMLSEERSCFWNPTLIEKEKKGKEKRGYQRRGGRRKKKKRGKGNLDNTTAPGVKILVNYFLKKKKKKKKKMENKNWVKVKKREERGKEELTSMIRAALGVSSEGLMTTELPVRKRK